MALEVINSKYSEITKNLNDLILLILAKEYPLKIGEICLRLRREFNVKLTFQAVRKSLNILVDKKILIYQDKAYAINKNFILDQKRFADTMLKNYFTGEHPVKAIDWNKSPEAPTMYTCDNLLKADQLCNEIILDWVHQRKKEDDPTFCFQTPHYWYIFGQLGVESNILEELRELGIDAYYYVDNATIIDKWTKQFYDAHHIKYVVTTKPTKTKTTIGVFGDFIVQYDYPEDVYKIIDEFYQKTKDLSTMNLSTIAKILKTKTPITLTVMKNKLIAAKLKEEMKSKFKKNAN